MSDQMTPSNKPTLAPIEMAQQLYKLQNLKNDVDERLRVVKAGLLETMKELGVLTLKTEGYTISRKTYSRPTILDDEVAKQSLEALNVPVTMKTVLDMEYMKEPIRSLLKEGKELEGISQSETEYVGVRLNKTKPAEK